MDYNSSPVPQCGWVLMSQGAKRRWFLYFYSLVVFSLV